MGLRWVSLRACSRRIWRVTFRFGAGLRSRSCFLYPELPDYERLRRLATSARLAGIEVVIHPRSVEEEEDVV